MLREAHAARPKSHIGQASKGKPTEASTSLRCYNVTKESSFVEGLQKAGLKVVPRNDPNQLVLAVQSRADARQIVKALHGCKLGGLPVHINIIDKGTQVGAVKGQLPKLKCIRRCVRNAFHDTASKEDLAQLKSKYATALQEVRRKIKASKVAKRQKANKDLTKEEEEAVTLEASGSESDESEGLDEEIHKQQGGEERGETRDDGFRPETSARQHVEVDETRSSLRGERSQSQDTACEGERDHGSSVVPSTRSSTPDDILSALYASLN